jgi:hypothetical protein
MDNICPYPHSTTPLRAPHQRTRAHLSVGVQPMPYHAAWSATFTLSPFLRTHARKHTWDLGAILYIDLRLFKVSLIQRQGDGVTWIDDVALE